MAGEVLGGSGDAMLLQTLHHSRRQHRDERRIFPERAWPMTGLRGLMFTSHTGA